MTVFLRGFILRILYPLLMLAGAFLKGKKESFQSFVIRLNNKIVTAEWRKRKKRNESADGASGRKMLLLLPHCLQVSDCQIRLTYNVNNCRRCGKCGIRDLLGISEEHHLDIFVATGGTIARRIVRDTRPDIIIAVACERDLSSGIVDTYPLPVYGIMNERPSGPCINTQVSMAKVREVIERFEKD